MMGIKNKSFNYIIKNAPFAKIFRCDIIRKNRIEFCENLKFSEDAVFNREYCRFIRNCAFSNEIWYDYFQYDFSAMHSVVKQNYIECIVEYWNVWNRLNDTEINNDLKTGLLLRSCLIELYDCVRFGVLPITISIYDKTNLIRKLLNTEMMMNCRKHIQDFKPHNSELVIRKFLFMLNNPYLILCSQWIREKLSNFKMKMRRIR